MSENNKDDNQVVISAYLNWKYGDDTRFEVQKVFEEFSGHRGPFTRAVCKSDKYTELFTVYLYKDQDENEDAFSYDGGDYYIQDQYANIVFANQYANDLKKRLMDTTFVKTQISLSNWNISKEMYDKGLEAFLETKDLMSFIRIFAIMDTDEITDAQKKVAENYLAEQNTYAQYLYMIIPVERNLEKYEEDYQNNYDDFDVYITKGDFAEQVDFLEAYQNKGVVQNTTLKEK